MHYHIQYQPTSYIFSVHFLDTSNLWCFMDASPILLCMNITVVHWLCLWHLPKKPPGQLLYHTKQNFGGRNLNLAFDLPKYSDLIYSYYSSQSACNTAVYYIIRQIPPQVRLPKYCPTKILYGTVYWYWNNLHLVFLCSH